MARQSPLDLIIVTGTPRSGTTAVGAVLEKAPHACAIHEPMNFETGDKVINRYFDIPGHNGFSLETFDDLVDRVRYQKLRLKRGLFPDDTLVRKIAKWVVGGRTRQSYRRSRRTPGLKTIIWKDPFIIFALDRLLETRPAPVIVCYRSPQAVAASFKRMNWTFDAYVVEATLRRGYLAHVPDLPAERLASPGYRGMLFWLYASAYTIDLIDKYGEKVIFLDMDDIVSTPVATYRGLFDRLGLDFSAAVERSLVKTFSGAKPSSDVPSGKTHTQNRDMSKINEYWRKTLSEQEIADFESICGPLERKILNGNYLARF